MPKRTPKYCLHRPTGQARVRIQGKDFYLGEYGSEESHQRYNELISRTLTGTLNTSHAKVTIAQLCIAYIDYARTYYLKHGRLTSEVNSIQQALRPLVRLHGRCRVSEFGPIKLKQVRDDMVSAGIVRKSINRNIGRIKRMFKWGVENEIIAGDILARVNAVAGLRFGRSAAVESDPVLPVPEHDIKAVQEYVSTQVWAMIQLQKATGMRPGEVRLLRTVDLDMSGQVWEYRPSEHKTEHHGRKRVIFIGPLGQTVLRPFLTADRERYVFSPEAARQEFDADRRENRKSPMTPSQAARRPKEAPKRSPGECYSVTSYARAIANACREAGIPVWSPNRLRHNAATELRKQYDIETVRTILGHATGFTTEIYAELDMAKARAVIGRVG
jgi:integrase